MQICRLSSGIVGPNSKATLQQYITTDSLYIPYLHEIFNLGEALLLNFVNKLAMNDTH